ncbi:hypothetical protein [Bacillus sp. AFS055030]|uniref:hypothetical protein n=1 Tax=Bacillus sp. AFS055030 TaxID=2033507 RepID=UPI000BFC1A8F|nr:hypothetical protein [Bacillus sp. AFS055030]PGL72207.1 hypothetical protein CN925_04825 [Bacillus sp. AFS055030]
MSEQFTVDKEKNLKQILSALKKEEIISIVLDLAQEYEEIEKGLLFKYSSNDDVLSNSKKLIKEGIYQKI